MPDRMAPSYLAQVARRRPLIGLVIALSVTGLLLLGLFIFRSHSSQSPFSPLPTPTGVHPPASAPPSAPSPTKAVATPSVRPVVKDWRWITPGFGGIPSTALTTGVDEYVQYVWAPACDYPSRHVVPMIWGKRQFYTDHVEMATLFDGTCNDGRPLLFLNEPAKVEQANISPLEAAHMFYTMTRGVEWPYSRWRGPVLAGNNLVEERQWDAEFVNEFARLYNGGSRAIPEIAGWGVHLYGNYEYGPGAGDPNVVWTEDIPQREISAVVDRSMSLLDRYAAERAAEGNSKSLVITEFGLLQASTWHKPPAFYYTTTVSFMEEYVRRFDLRPDIRAWFWYISTGANTDLLDVNFLVDSNGVLTPNGRKWRELASRPRR